AARLPAHRAAPRRRRLLGARPPRRRPRRPRHRDVAGVMTATAMHVLLCVGAYLVGSIPFGVVVAGAKGVDLRQVGSGNIGATNVARALGKGWAVAVLL